jgi:hypothetical protein
MIFNVVFVASLTASGDLPAVLTREESWGVSVESFGHLYRL